MEESSFFAIHHAYLLISNSQICFNYCHIKSEAQGLQWPNEKLEAKKASKGCLRSHSCMRKVERQEDSKLSEFFHEFYYLCKDRNLEKENSRIRYMLGIGYLESVKGTFPEKVKLLLDPVEVGSSDLKVVPIFITVVFCSSLHPESRNREYTYELCILWFLLWWGIFMDSLDQGHNVKYL